MNPISLQPIAAAAVEQARRAESHEAERQALRSRMDEILAHRVRTIEVVLPYDQLALADVFRSRGSVLAEEYRGAGVYYKATVKVDDLHRFEDYLI